MSVPKPGKRRLVGAALLTGGLLAVAFVAFHMGRLLLAGSSPGTASETILGVLAGGTLSTAWFVPLVLAVLLVVAGPSRRTVAGGAVLVYVVHLVLTVVRAVWTGALGGVPGSVPGGIDPVVLAVPLPIVATFLAVATAVWLAYGGGYERLVAATGDADQHPLFAVVADERIGPSLSLQRGLVAAGVGALVGVGGLVLAGGIADLLQAFARSGVAEPGTTQITRIPARGVGIPLTRLPVEWLLVASFLLAVLFVTGPRIWPRDVLRGIAVIFAVQSAVELLPALLSPDRPLELRAASGPILAPVGDAILLVALAVAVWLAFHGGLETLRNSAGSRPVPE